MMKKALRNGLILAIVSMLLFFKAIEFADSITGRYSIESPQYPITHPSAAGR
ncbi:hypothetical protein [Pseudomonas sp. 273]|uniref:hypothetical protein n=1 Tax=Pseudomonas sp. 273 TaxID=75692 RepID=UPI0023D89E3E|nr:hypothetical protein [Pseudomonas sp. 273]